MEQGGRRFVVLLPAKPPAFAKSRLRGLEPPHRRLLAEAFALDTAAACLAATLVEEVLVVTDDAALAGRLAARGCVTVSDGDGSGLNPALRRAAAEARRRWPDLVPAAVCADLPALQPRDLDAALGSLKPDEAGFVPDTEGTGTTMYVACHDDFDPHFGLDSCAAHAAVGARPLLGAASLRRDVDDLDDLRAAAGLGLGPESGRAFRALPPN